MDRFAIVLHQLTLLAKKADARRRNTEHVRNLRAARRAAGLPIDNRHLKRKPKETNR